MVPEALKSSTTPGAKVESKMGGWRLSIPRGRAGSYRLAQLDDYRLLTRRDFRQKPPLHLQLRARASQAEMPGTWGFGLWNDPFSFTLGFGGGQRLPALPNAAWFFIASSENHLSLNDALPGNGALATSFRSPRVPAPLLGLGALGLPLLIMRPLSRLLRRGAARLVQQHTSVLLLDLTSWHRYELVWDAESVSFEVDGRSELHSSLSPHTPLGLVIWLDNQYAAWRPDGRLAYGTLPTPEECWIEIADLKISHNR